MPHPRGKVLGGTSAINSFALIYPSTTGVDEWAGLGNKRWDWIGLAPYYSKFQTLSMPSADVKERYVSEGYNVIPISQDITTWC